MKIKERQNESGRQEKNYSSSLYKEWQSFIHPLKEHYVSVSLKCKFVQGSKENNK